MGDTREMAAKFEEVLKKGTSPGWRSWPAIRDRRLRRGMAAVGRAPVQGRVDPYGRSLSGDVRHESQVHLQADARRRRPLRVEGTIDYGDGFPVSYVGIGELRDGKVAKMTEYFANPFEAPAWRADFVERMEPVKA